MIEDGFVSQNRETNRRAFLQRAGAGAAALTLPGLLAACGSSSDSSTSTSASTAKQGFTPSSGTDIPRTTVKFGMAPYADASFYVIGMKRGWFNDVGIAIAPAPTGLQVTPDNVTTKLLTHEADIATYYGPGRIATMGKAPNLKMLGFSDTYLGTYFLAAPHSGIRAVPKLVASGTAFNQAIKDAMGDLKGKRVALDNTGEHRDFTNASFNLGGISRNDFKATVTNVTSMLALAKGGKIDCCDPNGAAQVIALLNDGWYPVVGVSDLLSGLPPGDPRAVASIGHEGPASSQEYYDKNTETVLRFMSVMFRIIDEIRTNPDQVLADQAPYVSAVSGTKTGVPELKGVYKVIDPLSTFEEQTQFWVDLKDPHSYQSVYNAQIKAAEAGGVLPKGKTYTADDAIIGRTVYAELVKLKKDYESLKGSGGNLEGKKAQLAHQAVTHAQHRNYLDAYRLQQAATAS